MLNETEIVPFIVAQIGSDGGKCFCCGKMAAERKFLHAMKVRNKDPQAVARIFKAADSFCTICSANELLVSACDEHANNLEVFHELAYSDVITAGMVGLARDHGEFLAAFLLFRNDLAQAQHKHLETKEGADWIRGRDAARAQFRQHLAGGVPAQAPLDLYMK